MASLNKDQVQRIVLGALFLVVGGVVVWNFLIAPQFTSIKKNTAEIEKLNERIKIAKRDIRAAEQISAKYAELSGIRDQVFANIPSGATITWFPPMMEKYFGEQGITNMQVTRGGSTAPAQWEIWEYQEMIWNFQFPETSYMKFAEALEHFETDHPLMQTTSLSIVGNVAEPDKQSVTMTSYILLPKTLN